MWKSRYATSNQYTQKRLVTQSWSYMGGLKIGIHITQWREPNPVSARPLLFTVQTWQHIYRPTIAGCNALTYDIVSTKSLPLSASGSCIQYPRSSFRPIASQLNFFYTNVRSIIMLSAPEAKTYVKPWQSIVCMGIMFASQADMCISDFAAAILDIQLPLTKYVIRIACSSQKTHV